MRALLAVLLVALVAGCFGGPATAEKAAAAVAQCRAGPLVPHTFYFGPSMTLAENASPVGFAPGNSIANGFVTNDLKEWLSAPVPEGMWLFGNVTLEFWARSEGSPAPLVVKGPPGQGYQFFNQFGTDRTFQPASAVEYSDPAAASGTVTHYTESLRMPDGGFVVEPGDRLRVLLTDLALPGPDDSGHDILFGGENPSHVAFEARCWPRLAYADQQLDAKPVTLAGNQGLLTGAVPASPANQYKLPLQLPDDVDRLTITLNQTSDPDPGKDDVDITLLDRAGEAVWSIGSPYTNESGALWKENLAAAFPDGFLTVQVDSYSGLAYSGRLVVTAATATSK